MAQDPALDVIVSGRHTGSLSRSEIDEDSFLFGYAQGCTAEDAVSLTMPVVRDQYDSMGTVHPIFEMNLPEGALLERLRVLFAKTMPRLDDLGLLSIVGQSQIGRLRYAYPGAHPADVPAESVRQLLTYEGAHDLFNDLLLRYATYSGVSGVQPKILLRADEAPPERVTTREATHIVKSFDPREYAELAANEFFCMQASRYAGIPTAQVSLSENRRILVIDRFDLTQNGTYLGVEDFCVLCGMRAHGRYDGSYEIIIKRIRQFVSPQHQAEAVAQLFAMLALCCAVENGDAHLKNFSVVYANAESAVRLAPAYDIISTTPYQPRDVMALTLADSKEFPDRKRLVAFGRQVCNLTERKVTEILRHVADGVRRSISDIRRYSKKRPDFATAGDHLIATFQRGLARSVAV